MGGLLRPYAILNLTTLNIASPCATSQDIAKLHSTLHYFAIAILVFARDFEKGRCDPATKQYRTILHIA